MIERANGRMTVPQIFIGATHVGGCDELYALDDAGKLDPLLAGEGQPHDDATDRDLPRRPDPDALGPRARRPISTPPCELIGEAKAAGADYVQTPEMTNIMEVKRERLFASDRGGRSRHLARDLPRAGAQARHLSPCRLAGDQGLARQGRQPLVPDRPEGRDRRALRQDPHVRRRSRRRRELSRVAQLPAGRACGAVPICRGAGSA